jgi:hypothetical protein
MIECVFTIDYEIYGNGEGSLRELVYEPAAQLKAIFDKWNAKFVTFVEVAEFDVIEANNTDTAIGLVKKQIKELYADEFEIGLHLHPQWFNARFINGRWILDYSEYNLCTLTEKRIGQIVDRSIDYCRDVLCVPGFMPLSFRAGNWLFQPTHVVAKVLAARGIKIDSSVFKGGLQYQHRLDYRRAIRNGPYWTFSENVNIPDSDGILLEIPIHTQMVPFWKMVTPKRFALQQKVSSGSQTKLKKFYRLLDLLRFRHPLKFDFCRMTVSELTHMMDKVIYEDRRNPGVIRPIVLIGHTKDLMDFETIEVFLNYLRQNKINVSTFQKVYNKIS